MLRNGDWWLSSRKDSRWNSWGLGRVGNLEIPEDCKRRIKVLEKTLGKQPDDLEFGYMKD